MVIPCCFLCFIVLASCVSISARRGLLIDKLSPIQSFRTSEPMDKLVFDEISGSCYTMHTDWQELIFFREGNLINKTGGLGYDKTNFQRLMDIALDTDGSLLALDSATRTVKKFTSDGKFSGEFELPGLRQPELFAVAGDQTLFIYDAIASEIVCFSALDIKEQYRFGRFELKNISSLSCNRNYVLAYSKDLNKTSVFSILGQHIITFPNLAMLDEQGNLLLLENGILKQTVFRGRETDPETAELLVPLTGVSYAGCNRNTVSTISQLEITNYKIQYLSSMETVR